VRIHQGTHKTSAGTSSSTASAIIQPASGCLRNSSKGGTKEVEALWPRGLSGSRVGSRPKITQYFGPVMGWAAVPNPHHSDGRGMLRTSWRRSTSSWCHWDAPTRASHVRSVFEAKPTDLMRVHCKAAINGAEAGQENKLTVNQA
jgi:hypothetical protein